MRYVEDARRKPMDFKLIIDPDKNGQVVVTAHRNSQQIEEIKALAMGKPSKECISGYDPQDEEYRILKIQDVNLFFVDDGKTYASAVAEARAQYGMSQKELAEATGIDQGDISRIERGISNPSVGTLERIAKALGKDLEIKIK